MKSSNASSWWTEDREGRIKERDIRAQGKTQIKKNMPRLSAGRVQQFFFLNPIPRPTLTSNDVCGSEGCVKQNKKQTEKWQDESQKPTI
jgi:hypothetical protein